MTRNYVVADESIVADEAREYASDMVYLADLMLQSHDLCQAIANLAMKDGFTVAGRFENVVDAIKQHAHEQVISEWRSRMKAWADDGNGGNEA